MAPDTIFVISMEPTKKKKKKKGEISGDIRVDCICVLALADPVESVRHLLIPLLRHLKAFFRTLENTAALPKLINFWLTSSEKYHALSNIKANLAQGLLKIKTYTLTWFGRGDWLVGCYGFMAYQPL